MEYGPFEFSRDGVSVVLETIPAGMVLGTSLSQYTTGDVDGLFRLYSMRRRPLRWTAIRLDSRFSWTALLALLRVFTTWAQNSTHSLSVPSANQTLQTLSQQTYIFGRWNAGSANVQTVSVTNSYGNGTFLSPTTSPAITNYLAGFIPIHPFSPVVAPSGDGTISSSPPPSLTINGTSYYEDRQLITVTATPNTGFGFWGWYNVPTFSFYANPYTFPIQVNWDFDNFDTGFPVTAGLVDTTSATGFPLFTITATSPDLTAAQPFPGFAIGIVEASNGNATTTAVTPQNFYGAPNYSGSGFAAGAQLNLCAGALNGTTCSAQAQSPVTTNISYLLNNWTGSANSQGVVTLPSSGQSTANANFTPSFRSIVLPSWSCGGNTVTSSPTGTVVNSGNFVDAFFNSGTVDFMAVAGSGMTFVGWSQDLAGTSNPLAFSISNQVIGTANFNASGTTDPLNDHQRFPGHSNCHQRADEPHR